MDDSGSRSASTASLGHATTVSVAVLGRHSSLQLANGCLAALK